jgi:hypothetical protein
MLRWARIATAVLLLVIGVALVLAIGGLTIWTEVETGNTYLAGGVAAAGYACLFLTAALVDLRSRRAAAVRSSDRTPGI